MKRKFFTLTFAIALMLVVMGTIGLKPHQEKSQDGSSGAKPDTAQIQMWLEKLNRAIEGKVDSPAAVVFQNIQTFKRLPAGRLLGMMKAWTRNLGVSCDHCHTIDQWEKDDKLPKQTARAMDKMEDDVNTLIKNVKTIQNDRAHISCWTCHRGQTKPETNPMRTMGNRQ